MQRCTTRFEGPIAARKTRRITGWLTALILGAAVNGGACFVHEPDVDPAVETSDERRDWASRATPCLHAECAPADRC